MKRILFICESFEVGGIQTSMINLINLLSNEYSISVFPYKNEGVLKERINSGVEILDSSWRFEVLASSLKRCKEKGKKFLAFKLFSGVWAKIFDNRLPIFLAIKHQRKLGKYDLVCAFSHEYGKHDLFSGYLRTALQLTDSSKILSWVHCDYDFVADPCYNLPYFNRSNGIVGVTKSVKESFIRNVPGVICPVYYCYNAVDKEMIRAKSEIPLDVDIKSDGIMCFSATRLSKEKGLVRAINAFSDIIKTNDVYWYIAGDGPEKDNIVKVIQNHKLEERVILLGNRKNPYNFFGRADLYLSTSYEEAAPMVYLEAKVLHVPIYTTRTLSSDELLDSTIDYISDNNIDSMKAVFANATSSKANLIKRKKMIRDESFNDFIIRQFSSWTGDK